MSKAWLEKHLKAENGKSLAIIIMIRNKTKTLKLCAKGLKFGRVAKVVEKY